MFSWFFLSAIAYRLVATEIVEVKNSSLLAKWLSHLTLTNEIEIKQSSKLTNDRYYG